MRVDFFRAVALSIIFLGAHSVASAQAPVCKRDLTANVVALDQAIMVNRLGSDIPGGMIYALARDVVDNSTKTTCDTGAPHCKPGQVGLREQKRPRPLVLRMGIGDCLTVNLTNLVAPDVTPDNLQILQKTKPGEPKIGTLWGQTVNRAVGFHPAGLELINIPSITPQPANPAGPCNPAMKSDGSFVGTNCSSLVMPGASGVFQFRAREEGHFLVLSDDDGSATSDRSGQQNAGLFGSITVEPENAEFFRSQVTQSDLQEATYVACMTTPVSGCVGTTFSNPAQGNPVKLTPALGPDNKTQLKEGGKLLWTLTTINKAEGRQTEMTSTVTVGAGNRIDTPDGHPILNYYAAYPDKNPANQPGGTPILAMLKPTGSGFEVVHSDLTAIITGPGAGRFPAYQESPLFGQNPALPDRREPFREFTIIYHVSGDVVQPFKEFSEGPLKNVLSAGADGFAINYGIGGIGPEVLANRLGVGPSKDCVECKFEEFFLSSWVLGDPAMVVDHPTAGNEPVPGKPVSQSLTQNGGGAKTFLQGTHNLTSSVQPALTALKSAFEFLEDAAPAAPLPHVTNTPAAIVATKAYYPDDPSNVYHSYMRDHVKFRIANVSVGQPHVHHQHAHQWLQSPNSDDSQYLDSQMIIPGSTYTLEMTYNGSGNRNQTVGDSIFHCHFYPHFAAGMWSLWRVHDVFEEGTVMNPDGAVAKVEWNRALPDGEIVTGTPIPAVVSLPTIGMAPLPAKVKLVDGGKRAVVKADGGEMGNPGYPFFVPGVAGHRAPHPPLDFAPDEEKSAATNSKVYLDGGLPRHLILDGTVTREFHTRWDFSKENGSLFAFILPEEGTDVERTAMRAHSQRTYQSWQPDGQPGTFTLNGLPPASGAPFARPDVDDNGNAVTNKRRYQAAVIQTDVALNKEGWHYPQQRMLALWNDVAPTMNGTRPPEPLFFRANSGDTVEFWHTNLVPGYYELDDFQVRTPTDIIGQHIHLVKFDVLASDGAANGFNYEDGTFSPDEVRTRITAINAGGGLHTGAKTASGDYPAIENCLKSVAVLKTCIGGVPRIVPALAAKPAPAVFGSSGDQNWTGAQTTIQLWQVDPLLNNRGRDRTVRTVFTHDHFGPSTHQNVGLYAGLLAEPTGSTWVDPLTNKPLSGRSDGGPTSWQANIITSNQEESYREFALEFQDLQLAYQPTSDKNKHIPLAPPQTGQPTAPQPLFTTALSPADVADLKAGKVRPAVSNIFAANGAILLKPTVVVCPAKDPFTWCLKDQRGFIVGLSQDAASGDFNAYTPDLEPGWANPSSAIGAPGANADTINTGAPYPLLVDSSPGIGTFSMNYRNEPLSLRLAPADKTNPNPPAHATDPAWAFASVSGRVDPRFNVQPEATNPGCLSGPPCPIDPKQPNGFKYPSVPLLGSPNPMQDSDPYTPMLRAYENDRVQIRTLVGAHVSTHPFMIHGLNWLYEPDYGNSGYKSLQGMGLSEHFELNFRAPAPSKPVGAQFSDYLYAPNSGVSGFNQGMWGLLRAYDGSKSGIMSNLAALPNNPKGAVAYPMVGSCPAGTEQDAEAFTVVAGTAASFGLTNFLYNTRNGGLADANALMYVDQKDLDSQGHLNSSANIEPLILRVHAGKCVTVRLINMMTTASAGLHAPELTYDVNGSDGINVGFNQIQTPGKIAPPLPGTAGPSQPGQPANQVQMIWYAGNVDSVDGKPVTIPIEFGSVPLLPADPISQAASGMVGALIVEPAGAKWQTDPKTRASATVTPVQGEPFREFVIVLQNGLSAVTSVAPRNGPAFTAAGGVNYRSEPIGLRMPPLAKSTLIKTPSEVAADIAALDDATGGGIGILSKSSLQPAFKGMNPPFTLIELATATNLSGTWSISTGGSGSSTCAATLNGTTINVSGCTANPVSLNATPDLLKALDLIIPLSTVQTAFSKVGITLGSNATSTYAGGRGWSVGNGVYSYTICVGSFSASGCSTPSAPLSSQYLQISFAIYWDTNNPQIFPGFEKFLSDTLPNNQDPQTPIFCAAAGQAVRFRVVQPGTDTDQMFEINGHSWQQEPYIHNGREIGNNPNSQEMGTQVISANDKLDLVLPSAGGAARIPGDYLYHAFMSQVNGLWGLFRVVPTGTDPVQACQTQPGFFFNSSTK